MKHIFLLSANKTQNVYKRDNLKKNVSGIFIDWKLPSIKKKLQIKNKFYLVCKMLIDLLNALVWWNLYVKFWLKIEKHPAFIFYLMDRSLDLFHVKILEIQVF